MEIACTQMDRGRLFDIGYARAHRRPDSDLWVIYCTFGPNWVWNHRSQKWIIVTAMSTEDWTDPNIVKDYETTMAQLAIVETKKQLEARGVAP
jgi:hypothetical protein